ncbi:Zinc metalloproteinase nas-4 [Pseudolycoriella hygida]|uniref:Metalloendopeptidase n=1 Tax=Pseudolycoriella hygida TaxID=35572 RepID=A0A9Q0N6M5_9DIPT|nr:Zinc metalloproteinase nas-4 [Pseudolycoriella hygida]
MRVVYYLLILAALLEKSLAVPERSNSSCVDGTQQHHLNRSKRNAFIHDGAQWPNGRVPYTLDARFTTAQRAAIAEAMNEYHTKTCVRFVDRQPNDVDYVQLLLDDGVCGLSLFCKQGGAGWVKLGSTCLSMGKEIVTHELGHTLCFEHETDRFDRDDYISFDSAKCSPYSKNTVSDSTTLDLLFDYLSVQFYEPPFVDGCIVPKLPGVTKGGSGGPLSVLDAEKVNAYYKCGGCFSYRFRPPSLITSNDVLVGGGIHTYGDTLHVCRGYFNGDILLGKTIMNANVCWVPYNGAEHQLFKYEILTNPQKVNLRWMKSPGYGIVPPNAVPGGRSAIRDTLYICRYTMVFDGKSTTLLGKYHWNGCYVSYGYEYYSLDFEFLVCD